MVFVSHQVPFPATRDRRSRVAGNGTECEVKTIKLSSPTSGGEQWALLYFLILTEVKKTGPKLRKFISWHIAGHISAVCSPNGSHGPHRPDGIGLLHHRHEPRAVPPSLPRPDYVQEDVQGHTWSLLNLAGFFLNGYVLSRPFTFTSFPM